MKKIIILLSLLPLASFAQNWEFNVSGGLSVNTMPPIAKDENAEYKASTAYIEDAPSLMFSQGGLGLATSLYLGRNVSKHIKVGLSVSGQQLSMLFPVVSGQIVDGDGNASWQIDPEGKKNTVRFYNPAIAVAPEVGYSLVKSKRITLQSSFRAGLLILIPTSNGKSTLPTSPTDLPKTGAIVGLSVNSAFHISKSMALTISVSPAYNHIKSSKPPRFDVINYSVISVPAQLGLSFYF